MESVWGCILLGALLSQAAALRCYSCDGDRSCQETEDCGEQQGRCRTTALTMISRSGVSDRIQKGCDVQGKPNNSISFFSHGQIVMLAEEHCATDLCNQGVPNALSSFPSNTSLDCLSCSSSDHSCSSPSLMQIRCPDPREQCVDITAISMPEEFPQDERRIKGCGQISRCQEPLGFHNQDSFYLLQCCNSSLCNNDAHDYQESPLPLNGVTCFACEGNSSHGCTPENITRLQCQGPMTHCMEAVGSHALRGPGAMLKGCATPAWCDTPYTSIYKRLAGVQARCCRGNFCNSRIQAGALPPARRSRAGRGLGAQPALLYGAALLALLVLLPRSS
ncbi:urokinase plasminogen activator surface receptor [Chelonia mydas]|uniref:urokinase plasminogen activator surface receptor n=1 Tax=Chelonia mydas TaxID=8469 RepID=UPI000FFBE6DE|nr:urokinase plasminogen activator surface receptor [Chelonia mydas]